MLNSLYVSTARYQSMTVSHTIKALGTGKGKTSMVLGVELSGPVLFAWRRTII
jgi:hypothetical protein